MHIHTFKGRHGGVNAHLFACCEVKFWGDWFDSLPQPISTRLTSTFQLLPLCTAVCCDCRCLHSCFPCCSSFHFERAQLHCHLFACLHSSFIYPQTHTIHLVPFAFTWRQKHKSTMFTHIQRCVCKGGEVHQMSSGIRIE